MQASQNVLEMQIAKISFKIKFYSFAEGWEVEGNHNGWKQDISLQFYSGLHRSEAWPEEIQGSVQPQAEEECENP